VVVVRRLFFFESYVDPRDLHSFPTRRSSDLSAKSRSGAGCSRRLNELVDGERRQQRRQEYAAGDDVAEQIGVEPAENRATVDAGDRKSTRLNSSHLGISYAVFCLKKKKK